MKHITIMFASGRTIQVERRWYDWFLDGWGYRSYHLLDGKRVEIFNRQIEQRIWEAR